MDHSFKDRVDKVFGSISSSASTPWSLTGELVEKRAWNRDKRDITDDDDDDDDDGTLVSSTFDNFFSNRRKGINDDGLRTENDGDEWDIRSSIGLDSTLDNEEEEDAYDKMAQGRENGGDRLYMKDVTDHGPYLKSHNVLPGSVNDIKDPRANHDAAKTRLKEDEDTLINAAEEPCEDGIRIKSILKRKSDTVVKPAKRVRFDPTCKIDNEYTNTIQLQQQGFASENERNVPDYILNPSKYTRYDFDDVSHDVNEGSNSEAYKDFLEQVKQSNHVGLEQKSGESSAADLPRSVPFIPRKNRGEGKAACNSEGQVKQSSIQAGSVVRFDIAALEEVQQGEIIEMQEDKSHADAVCTIPKPGRRYRSKMEEDEDDVC